MRSRSEQLELPPRPAFRHHQLHSPPPTPINTTNLTHILETSRITPSTSTNPFISPPLPSFGLSIQSFTRETQTPAQSHSTCSIHHGAPTEPPTTAWWCRRPNRSQTSHCSSKKSFRADTIDEHVLNSWK